MQTKPRTLCLVSVSALVTFTLPQPLRAADPVIHVAWDTGGTPEEGVHYIISTTSPASPDFPDIELVTGRLDWRIWSTDTDNPGDIGDIGVITSPYADNFAVSLVNYSHPFHLAARDVKGISLVPASSNNYSNITIARVTGSLVDELTVQANTSGTGGEVWWNSSGPATADMTIRKANYFGVSNEVSGTIVIDELVGGLDIGHLTGDISIGTTSGNAYFRIFSEMTGSVSVSVIGNNFGDFYTFFPTGIAPSGRLTFDEIEDGALLDLWGDDMEGTIEFLDGIPDSWVLYFEGDMSGSILANGDIEGNIAVDGDVDGQIIADADSIDGGGISGDVTINGEFNGNICGANLSPMESLPENIVIGTFGSNGHICGARPGCGGGTISDSTPPDGTIDARQPHPVDDCSLGARQGIGSVAEPIVITLSEGGANNLDCWALCETGVEAVDSGEGCSALDDNAIASVTETSTGVYEIVLDRPISAGYWTQITYLGDDSSVWYASLPGDANGSRGSTAADITALIDYINQTASPPHGIYSTDINHSGALTSADVSRLIDLLNGADTFIVWYNKTIPAYHPTCGGESLGGGGSEEQDDPEAFAAFLITYVATADPQGEAATALFDSLADAMAGWVMQHFTGAQQAALVEALSDPGLTFASEAGAAKAAQIVELLGG